MLGPTWSVRHSSRLKKMESKTVASHTEQAHKKKRRKLMSLAMSTEFLDFEIDKLKVELDLDDRVNDNVAADTSGDSRNSHSKKKRKSKSSTIHEATVSENISDCETGRKKSKKKVREIQMHNDDSRDTNTFCVEGQKDGFDVNSDVLERPHKKKKAKHVKNRNAESSAEDCRLNGDDGNMSETLEIKGEDVSEFDTSPGKLKSKRKSYVQGDATFSRFKGKTLVDDISGEIIQNIIEERQEELISINDAAHVILKDLKIVVPYKEHPSRQYETTLLKPPSQEIKMNIASTGLEMKSGKFNLEEDNILKRNWEDFVKEYGIRNPQYFLRFSNNRVISGLPVRERIPFVKYLARDLEYRYLQSIYKRFRKLYKQTEASGKFSIEEDAIIKKYISQDNIKFPHAKIALVLNRSRDAVYRRSRFLRILNEESDKMDEARPRCLWSMDKKTHLVVSLLKRTNSERVKQLRDIHITPDMWAAVAEDIGIRSRIIQHFWEQRLYTQLFAKQPVLIKKTCMNVLEKLNTSRVTYWQDIKWNEIAQDFPGVTGVFLWVKFKDLVKKKVPPTKWEVLRKCVKYLTKHWLPTAHSEPDKSYERYRFRNGQLVKK